MRRTEFIGIVSNCLRENIGKDVEIVADNILKVLKERKAITIEMTCDFCEEACKTNWCDSSYKVYKHE